MKTYILWYKKIIGTYAANTEDEDSLDEDSKLLFGVKQNKTKQNFQL